MQLKCYPSQEGLYYPEFEHDACGVGFVAHIKGKDSHAIVSKSLELLATFEPNLFLIRKYAQSCVTASKLPGTEYNNKRMNNVK